MNPRKIVITSIITILLISIVLSIIGWNTQDYDSRFSEQECKRSGSYCVFNGIPPGMLYSKPSESIDSVDEFQGNVEDYVYNIHTLNRGDINKPTPRPTEFYLWDIEDYRCKSTDEKPEVIDYFSEFCRGVRNGYGCGEERRALICGTGYLIQDVKDYNTKLYGPYDMPETIN